MKVVVPLITAALLVGAAVILLWWMLVAAAAYGLYRGGRWVLRRHRARVEIAGHRRAELLARAELQHRWFMAGDPRGTYGRYSPVPTMKGS
jgi:hypothetical protein